MLKKIFIMLGISMIAFAVGSGLTSKSTTTVNTTVETVKSIKTVETVETKVTPVVEKEKLEVLTSSLVKEGYLKYVSGTVRNNSTKQYGYVQIQFNLYDKDGSQVGSAMANLNNLEPNGIWKYKAIVMDDEVTSFKLKGVTGF